MKSLRKSLAIVLAVLMLISIVPMSMAEGEAEAEAEAKYCEYHPDIELEEKVEKAPTCEKPGQKSLYCSECEIGYYSERIDPLGHKPGEDSFSEEIPATCLSDGTKAYYICSNENCGKKIVEVQGENEEVTYKAVTDEELNIPMSASNHDFTKEAKEERYVSQPGDCCNETIYYKSYTHCGLSSKGIEGKEATFTGDRDKTNHANYSTQLDQSTVKKATCTEDGYTGDTICTGCEAVVTHGTVLKGKHTFTDEKDEADYLKSEADCTSPAIYYKSCSKCGASSKDAEGVEDNTFTVGEIDSTKHQAKEDVEWTYTFENGTNCDIGGVAVKTCKCGEELEKEEITAHSPEKVAGKDPSCTEDGYKTYYACKYCGMKFGYVKIDKLGHDYVEDAAVDPTCTETGLTKGEHCSRCNDKSIPQEEIPALKHVQEFVNEVDATCTEDGSDAGIICSRCKDVLSGCDKRKKLGHDPEKTEAKAANCTEDGNIEYYTCKREECGIIYIIETDEEGTTTEREITLEETVVPHTGHTWNTKNVVYTEGKEPTCTKDGEGTFSCINCDATEVKTIEAFEHDWDIENATPNKGEEPTCTKAGKGIAHCKNSGCEETNECVIPALKHEWTEIGRHESTCVENGKIDYECSRCEETKTEDDPDDLAPENGHEWYDEYTVEIAPTCYRYGVESKHCKVCDAKGLYKSEYNTADELEKCTGGRLDQNTIEKSNHTLSEREAPATCLESGEKYSYCINENCDYKSEPEEIPAKGHDFDVVGNPASCFEASSIVKTCKVCQFVEEDKTAKLEHVDANKDAKCDLCGTTMCDCLCHREGTWNKILYNIVKFFWDLFRINQYCGCGEKHYDITFW